MLSNLQKNILLKYPLLWNTKFIPMAALGILLHIFCFFTGYFDGTIDFTKKYDSLLEAPFFYNNYINYYSCFYCLVNSVFQE